MYYPRYFKLGQDLTLNRVFLDPSSQNQTDSLSGQIALCENSQFIVHFPYQSDGNHVTYPFFPGMPFVMHSEYHGLGIRVSVTFEENLGPGLVSLQPTGNLEFFYLREHHQIRQAIWLGCQREEGSLLTMRRMWRRHVDRFRSVNAPDAVKTFAKQLISLGEDGINLALEAPVILSELALVHLAIDDGGPLICTLTEVVQVDPVDESGKQPAGLHILNILDEDRTRIKRYIKKLAD